MNITYTKLTTEEIVFIGSCVEFVESISCWVPGCHRGVDFKKRIKTAKEFLNSLESVNK